MKFMFKWILIPIFCLVAARNMFAFIDNIRVDRKVVNYMNKTYKKDFVVDKDNISIGVMLEIGGPAHTIYLHAKDTPSDKYIVWYIDGDGINYVVTNP